MMADQQPAIVSGVEPEETPKLDEDGKPIPDLFYDEESPNLVEVFAANPEGKKALEQIGDRAIRDFDADWDANGQRREQFKKDWGIFSGNLPKKTWPFAESANTHVPIAFENTTRNWARAFAELFGDWTDVFGVAPLGPNDEDMAQLLTLHGNWQLRQQIPDFKRQMARGMLLFFFLGDVTCHSFWNPETEQNRHEILTLDEFVVPYGKTSTMPDYSDQPHRSKILKLYRHEIEARRTMWQNVDELIADNIPSLEDEPEQTISDDLAKARGVEAEVSEEKSPPNAPYKFIQYEGWLRLPNQSNDRFCQVVVEYKTKKVMQLLILEEPDWQDVQRFESQEQELRDYQAQMQAFLQAQEQQQMAMGQLQQEAATAAPEMGMAQNEAVQQSLEGAAMAAQAMQPPAPPGWTQDPEDPKNPDDPATQPRPPKRVPVHLFSHGVLIESLVGGLGLGYGSMQCDFNRAANTALSQFTDAATFANIPFFIAPDILQLPDRLEVSPGKVQKIPGVGMEEIQNALIPIKLPPANPQLIEVVDKMVGYGQSSMQSPSVLSGEPGKSGETARGMLGRIEQATKQLSVSTRMFADPFLCQILRNNAQLNVVNLKDEELFHVAAAKGQIPSQMKIGRRMYERNYHVEIRADLRFVSQSQKVQEADEMAMMVKQFPQLQQNQAFCYMVMKKMLQARKQDDMIPLLGQMPPPPQFFGTASLPPPGAVPAVPPPGAAPPGASPQPGPQGPPGGRPMMPLPGRAA